MNEIYNEEDIITNWFRSRMDKKKKEWTITLIIGGTFILLKIFSSY